ncbi:hypothetical protein GJ496_003060 [Pomphorhynchus laevis]|nr:hypothetical protein GJ496_003060 [Pomphorhynchus laevis]
MDGTCDTILKYACVLNHQMIRAVTTVAIYTCLQAILETLIKQKLKGEDVGGAVRIISCNHTLVQPEVNSTIYHTSTPTSIASEIFSSNSNILKLLRSHSFRPFGCSIAPPQGADKRFTTKPCLTKISPVRFGFGVTSGLEAAVPVDRALAHRSVKDRNVLVRLQQHVHCPQPRSNVCSDGKIRPVNLDFVRAAYDCPLCVLLGDHIV